MTFDEIELGKTYRDTLTNVTGVAVAKYEGIHVKNIDFQPKALDTANLPRSYWAWPSDLVEVAGE